MNALSVLMGIVESDGALGACDMSSNRDRVVVNPNGDWQKIVQILLPDYNGLGTVQIGNDTECALVIETKTLTYYAVDVRGYRALNQRKVRAALGLPEPAGQPRKGYEIRNVYSVRLEDSLAEYLRAFGDGNLSEGVSRMAADHKARSKSAAPEISFPACDLFHTARKTVVFQAVQGGEAVECEISAEALRDYFGAGSMKANDLFRAFLGNRYDIYRVAREKLEAGAEICSLTTDDFEHLRQ